MFIQATTPRPVFDVFRHPEHVVIHALAKDNVSTGRVYFDYTIDPEHGQMDGKTIQPTNTYAIRGEAGFEVHEYVLPFWDIFNASEFKEVLHDGEMCRSGSVALVRHCTGGVYTRVRSAYRKGRTYEEHVMNFVIVCPVTGGGIVRVENTPWDITNSSFKPWSASPSLVHDLEIEQMYNRNHCGGDRSSIEARKAARIAATEASMAREADENADRSAFGRLLKDQF